MATAKLTPEQIELKVESYFQNAPEFAQEIIDKIRKGIVAADPDLKPTWKWSVPVYEKKGPGLIGGLGIFKQHVSLSFFQGALLSDPHGVFTSSTDAKTMRTMKFTDASQVKEEIITEYFLAALQLQSGTALKSVERDTITIPDDLKTALAEGQQLEKFEKMAYTHRKEYVRWVTEAKRAETRQTRIGKTVERIAEGKKFS